MWGRSNNNGSGDETKLLPIAKWLQYHLLWQQCGYTQTELEDHLEEITTESQDSLQLLQQLFEETKELSENTQVCAWTDHR
jgi:hypothetical protein